MRIGFVQFRPLFGEVAANVDTMLRLVGSAEADLLVLPELATSGYTLSAREEIVPLAEPFESSPSLDALQKLARERSCALVVGFVEERGGDLFNSAALLRPDGTRELYRKVHLFGMENLFFAPGDIPFAVHEYAGVKLGMMICFDWFFPESMRVLALKGAQIVCHPVNFVLPWGPSAMVIRSLENHVSSRHRKPLRFGDQPRHHAYIHREKPHPLPRGEVLGEGPDEGDAVVVADIDPSEASSKRINKFNDLFAQRRVDLYGDITKN